MNVPPYFAAMPLPDLPGRVPKRAVRVVSAAIWQVLEQPWQDSQGGRALPPRLAAPRSPVTYVTDPESLQVCRDAEDVALRLTLDEMTKEDIRSSGCILVYLTPRAGMEVPDPLDNGLPKGLTRGGAREWVLRENPELDSREMEAFVIQGNGARWGPVILDHGAKTGTPTE